MEIVGLIDIAAHSALTRMIHEGNEEVAFQEMMLSLKPPGYLSIEPLESEVSLLPQALFSRLDSHLLSFIHGTL